MLPTTRVCVTWKPLNNWTATRPELSRKRTSAVPSPLKSPVASRVQD
jgi:hypothetical protein